MAILGIDEVGRGPWAGPLVVGACILPERTEQNQAWLEQLTDSKRLTAKKRGKLDELIRQHATVATGWVSAQELDEIGLGPALRLATRRAVEQIQQAGTPYTEIIIDGTQNFLKDTSLGRYVTVLKKADLLIKEVSAASIVAKVARDRYMVELASKYPGYGFERHVGYGTAAHRAALAKLGPCPEHRMSFAPLKRLSEATSGGAGARTEVGGRGGSDATSGRGDGDAVGQTSGRTTTATGGRAEEIVAEYLQRQGHQLVARNHKTKFYEIDIISAKDQMLYFTEVKYRKSSGHGTPLEAITARKQQQLRFAAEAYLKYLQTTNSPLQHFQPILAAAAVSGPDFQLDEWFPICQ